MAPMRVPGLRRPDTLFQQTGEPVFMLGSGSRLLYVNPAWEALTGFQAEAVIGQECPPHGPTRPGDPLGMLGSFAPPAEALAGRPASTTTMILRADGQRLWKRLEFCPHRDDQGALLFLFGLVRSVEEPPQAPEADSQRLRRELMEVRDRLLSAHGTDALIGQGPAHRRLLEQVRTAALGTMPVLIVGPKGTGRRSVARAIHQQGPRGRSPLLPFDCSAMPPELLDRELFGHSEAQTPPKLAHPEGTTILLGDLLDLPRDVQMRLALALEASAVGGRLLAYTAGDIDRARRDDRLRDDLYYALTSLVIPLPPLRERLDDLPLLAQHFLERANRRGDRRRDGFQPEAMEAICAYDWPGNLRELARVIDDSHARGRSASIGPEDLPVAILGNLGSAYLPPPRPPEHYPLDEMLERLERRLIEQALQRARRNKSLAARLLHISRPRLHRRINELRIPDEPETAEDGSSATSSDRGPTAP
ncbi:hypothetical protein BH23PLA1_BH23PLA1_09280 [soil metagenome]